MNTLSLVSAFGCAVCRFSGEAPSIVLFRIFHISGTFVSFDCRITTRRLVWLSPLKLAYYIDVKNKLRLAAEVYTKYSFDFPLTR
jgi:hypothetical protein